jgi:hypothetical protein
MMTRFVSIILACQLFMTTHAKAEPFDLSRVGDALRITFPIGTGAPVIVAMDKFIEQRALPQFRHASTYMILDHLVDIPGSTVIAIDNFFTWFAPVDKGDFLAEINLHLQEQVPIETFAPLRERLWFTGRHTRRYMDAPLGRVHARQDSLFSITLDTTSSSRVSSRVQGRCSNPHDCQLPRTSWSEAIRTWTSSERLDDSVYYPLSDAGAI